MLLTNGLSRTLTDLIQPVIADLGLELIEISSKQDKERNILEIVIDKENGVTVDDCAIVSRKVSLLLDVEDIIQQKYFLEVGSPGIFRELRNETDFLRNTNSRVKAVFVSPVKGQKKFVGLLKDYKNQTVTLSNDSCELIVELNKIEKINLFPEL